MKIQILLAAYNGARYIETQLDSQIAQQHGANDRYENEHGDICMIGYIMRQ